MDNAQVEHMIQYLQAKVLRKRSVQIGVDTPLVSSGIVDSFALVDMLLELERVTNRRIPATSVQPEDMDTVRMMFETAERVGKPRNV